MCLVKGVKNDPTVSIDTQLPTSSNVMARPVLSSMKSGTFFGLTGLPAGKCNSLSINWGIERSSGTSG